MADEEPDAETESTSDQNGRQGYEAYGAFNYIMIAREETGRTLDQILESPIIEVFYIVCWRIDKTKWEERQIKQWKATH